MKILVVEDNPMNFELVSDLLEVRGHTVIRAVTGKEALEAVSKETPDLILMDIQIPEIDGLTVTKMLKSDERFKNIPVIALTAHAIKGYEEEIKNAGCNGYITKPIDVKNFVKQVEEFFKSSE